MRPIAYFLPLFCLLAAPALFAGAGGSQLTVQFRVLALDRTFADITYQSGGRYVNVSPVYASVGALLTYNGPNPMQFYRTSMVDGREQARAVGQVSFPGSGRFLVILNSSTGGTTVTGVAVPDSPGTVPARAVRILNATPISLVVECNDEKNFTLRTGETKIVNIGSAVRADVFVRVIRQGQIVDLTNNFYTNSANIRRTLILVLNNPDEIKSNPEALPMVDILAMNEVSTAARRGQ